MATKKEEKEAAEIYAKDIRQRAEASKTIIIESPMEIAEQILGQPLLEFEVLTSERSGWHAEADCAEEEIHLTLGGKEMVIYINEDGKLCVYTD